MTPMRLECRNKYFPYGLKSRLITALLYTYTNKIVYDEILQSKSVVYCVGAFPVRTPMYGLPLNHYCILTEIRNEFFDLID